MMSVSRLCLLLGTLAGWNEWYGQTGHCLVKIAMHCLLAVVKCNLVSKILFYKPMPIDYKCRETYSKAMLEIDTCGKSLSVFLSKSVSKRVFFLSPCHARGVPLKSPPLLPVLRW